MKPNDSQIFRATWHDYRDAGFYMITMVTEDRQKAFGRLVGDSEKAAHIELNALGAELERCILAIGEYYEEVEVIDHIVMEDHCHICLQVKRPMAKHLGAVVASLKKVTTTFCMHLLNMQDHALHLTLQTKPHEQMKQRARLDAAIKEAQQLLSGDTALNIAQKKERPGRSLAEEIVMVVLNNVQCGIAASTAAAIAALPVVTIPPLWQEGYHDRIVTRYGQIADQRRYIHRNAARLWFKRHAGGDVTKVRMVRFPLPLALARELKNTAVYWDQRRDVFHSPFTQRHDGAVYAHSYVELVQKFLRYDAERGVPFLRFKQCGDGAMLESGCPLVRVRISRSVTEQQFVDEVKRILDLCEREGAIAISPFRSWSEKAVLTLLRRHGYKHIIIHGEAMWDGWKPQDGSTATHHQAVPEWFKVGNYNGGQVAVNMGKEGMNMGKESDMDKDGIDKGDMAEVYAGRCLILAPWADRPRSERAGKADCEVMNEMCRVMEKGIQEK